MKQFVVMNSNTGDVGLAMRCTLTDNVVYEEPLMEFGKGPKKGNYLVVIQDRDAFDGWLLESSFGLDTNCWIFINRKVFESKIEVVCEL